MNAPSDGMVVVSKEEFYSVMMKLDVHPRSEPDCSIWETRNREVIGISRPGYKCEGPEVYMLTRKANG